MNKNTTVVDFETSSLNTLAALNAQYKIFHEKRMLEIPHKIKQKITHKLLLMRFVKRVETCSSELCRFSVYPRHLYFLEGEPIKVLVRTINDALILNVLENKAGPEPQNQSHAYLRYMGLVNDYEHDNEKHFHPCRSPVETKLRIERVLSFYVDERIQDICRVILTECAVRGIPTRKARMLAE